MEVAVKPPLATIATFTPPAPSLVQGIVALNAYVPPAVRATERPGTVANVASDVFVRAVEALQSVLITSVSVPPLLRELATVEMASKSVAPEFALTIILAPLATATPV